MTEEAKPDTTFILTNVRMSFPDLFVPKQFQGKGDFKYSATFLVVPGSENDKTIRAAISRAAQAQWHEKAEATLKGIVGQDQKFCYLDGNAKQRDGYPGHWALSTKRNKKDGAPKVLDRIIDPETKKLRVVGPDEGLLYAGCYVNAKVQVWAQQNEWGPGMRCTLMTVQFAGDGESFGGAPPATDDGFESTEVPGNDLF